MGRHLMMLLLRPSLNPAPVPIQRSSFGEVGAGFLFAFIIKHKFPPSQAQASVRIERFCTFFLKPLAIVIATCYTISCPDGLPGLQLDLPVLC